MPFGGLSKTSEEEATRLMGLDERQTGAKDGMCTPEIETWITLPPAVAPVPVTAAKVFGL